MKFILLIFILGFFQHLNANSIQTSNFSKTPIVFNGRIVPFDTYARYFSKSIANNQGLAGIDPVKFCLKLLDTTVPLQDHKVFALPSKAMQRLLNISNSTELYSQSDLLAKDQFQQLLRFYKRTKDKTKNTDPDMVAFTNLMEKFEVFKEFVNGESLYIFPSKDPKAKWLNLPMLKDLETTDSNLPVQHLKSLLLAIKDKNQNNFDKACVDLQQFIYLKDPSIEQNRLTIEIMYNKLRPFAWSYMLYIFTLMVGVLLRKSKFWYISLCSGIFAFFFTSLGIFSRIYILNRPPVGNSYESIIFASWCCIAVSLVFFHKRTKQDIFLLGVLTTVFILSSKFVLPAAEDLLNLNAVLTSNAWLSLHVLTTVCSYAILAFSSILAHYYLYLSTKADEPSLIIIKYIHNSIKCGVFLLGFGTVLGGIWAHNSWGRFWAWNPKETWVLITLISYLLILHAKRVGWIKEYIVALLCILAFILLLVAWYGVNIFLNTGEHTFSIGVASSKVAILFVLLELLYITTIQRKRVSRYV
ncbi:MAG: cytochrome c biogenesis protein CcsA [Candidatus Cloacimonetes bacterium]|nr:cytochrome c biogenesis protein CcsA [Candidatus Cloacimonadota bacterium]